jgi:hypothetical protein
VKKELPKDYSLIELTDVKYKGKILLFGHTDQVAYEVLYNAGTHRWEWAVLSPDYVLPFSPVAGAYKDITREEAVAKYPTILKDLEKPVDKSMPLRVNDFPLDAIDPYGSYGDFE